MKMDCEDVDLENIYRNECVLYFLKENATKTLEKQEIEWRIIEYEKIQD